MIMTKQELIDLIVVLIDELDRDLSKDYILTYNKDLFKQLTYEKWAYTEILKRVADDSRGPYVIVEEFCKEMDHCSMLNRKTSLMFSSAYDAAMNILDVIISEDNWRKP